MACIVTSVSRSPPPHGFKSPKYKIDLHIGNAKQLAEGEWTVSNEHTDENPDLLQSLLVNRVISKNLRSIVKRGGYCLRVELANARRERTYSKSDFHFKRVH